MTWIANQKFVFQAISNATISQSTYDLNNEILVRYSIHGLNNTPFNKQTILDQLKIKLVCYSDPTVVEVEIHSTLSVEGHQKGQCLDVRF